ncbi:MAG: PrkA family serine protein kinase [Firmicutes bacterium]|nr:PrkA family serine protein kinase [Bacillota bacterium]
MAFLDELHHYEQTSDTLQWQGTFADYLEIVHQHPQVARLAHQRIYDMICSYGITKDEEGNVHYPFFEEELFGLDETLSRLVNEYFAPAAHRLDVRKRILLLMGPVSGGKSTLVTLLKRGLERYSRTEQGALYAIAGCPMHEEPLHLIPEALRDSFAKEYGITIEGNLCPRCQLMLDEQYHHHIEAVPVVRIFLSEQNRCGIGTFTPSDPKSQDIADLTGSIDFSTIAEYGSESDPRAYRFDGELNKANRGLMEFQEMLKLDEKFMWNLLSLTQEGNFKAGRFALISADEMIVAHTNETEYRAFIQNKKNEALHSRIVVMPIPYNLKLSQEVRIYEKLIRQSDLQQVHLAPHALRAAAIFSILTRLTPPKKGGVSPLAKMKLYDGEQPEGLTDGDLRELKAEDPTEGMRGIDPRYVINRISAALIESGQRCINALDILKSLKEGLEEHPSISAEEKERYLNLIGLARQEYDQIAENEIQRAFVYAFEESAKTLFDNYVDNVEAFCQNRTIQDPITEEQKEPDEALMRAVEEQIGVTENQKRTFREEVMVRIASYARKGRSFDYRTHQPLKEAIEKKLFADLRDVIKITTSTKTPNEEQLRRINEVQDRLIAQQGYCPICANEILRYVGNLLNR